MPLHRSTNLPAGRLSTPGWPLIFTSTRQDEKPGRNLAPLTVLLSHMPRKGSSLVLPCVSGHVSSLSLVWISPSCSPRPAEQYRIVYPATMFTPVGTLRADAGSGYKPAICLRVLYLSFPGPPTPSTAIMVQPIESDPPCKSSITSLSCPCQHKDQPERV